MEDLRAGIGPAIALNMNRAAPKEGEEQPPPVSALAFFPWHTPPPPPKPPPEETPEERSAKIRAMLNRAGKAAQRKANK